ncbi:MAG: MFS transporter [Trueperaceae bacterium]|nr:MFS transporter [Trueperaceae bacterium]
MRSALRDPKRRSLLVAAALGLLGIGALQAMYGPAFPGLIERYGVGVDAVGLTVVLNFAGSFVATVASSVLLVRVGYRPVLFGAGATMTAGVVLAALAPTWTWLLIGAAAAGLGFGLLNVAFNLLIARVFAPNAAPILNLMSAVFGVGAVLGPVAVGAAGGSLRLPFLGLALLVGMATVLSLRVPEPEAAPTAEPAPLPWLAAIGFVALYALYVATESGVASWETVHLEPSLGARSAAFMTSVFWIALTIGRLLAIPLSARIAPRTLVLLSSGAGLAALTAAHVTSFAPVAYALAGLTLAPVFPTTLAWIERVFPRRSERIVPLALAVANVGPVAGTAAIGAWVAHSGPGVIPTALSGVAACLLVVVALLWIRTRHA